jgi:hypothetical protein
LTTSEIEIDSYGEQRKTKVYAGGAVIAEQRSFSNSSIPSIVVWIHADPISGSKQEVEKSGNESPTLHNRTELEPLGQRVNPNPPNEAEPPANPIIPAPPPAGFVDFPEWQCTLPESSVPLACKNRAAATDLNFYLIREGNPNRIPLGQDGPMPRGYSPNSANQSMAFALGMTTKPGLFDDTNSQ